MAAVGARSSGCMSTATAIFGSSIAASTRCRPASPPVSVAAMPIRRSCNLIHPAGYSRALAQACLSIHTGFTVDHEGNLWVSDVNDKETVLGMSARNPAGVVLGQEVLKLDQTGKVLMMLGKMGVGGKGTDVFDRPTGVA